MVLRLKGVREVEVSGMRPTVWAGVGLRNVELSC
jgi:hypothetical protein